MQMLLVIDVVKGIQTQTAEVHSSNTLTPSCTLTARAVTAAAVCPCAQCLVIGEITTDRLIVVLNKVDQLAAAPAEREKELEKVKARIGKALANTRFAGAVMVCLFC